MLGASCYRPVRHVRKYGPASNFSFERVILAFNGFTLVLAQSSDLATLPVVSGVLLYITAAYPDPVASKNVFRAIHNDTLFT